MQMLVCHGLDDECETKLNNAVDMWCQGSPRTFADHRLFPQGRRASVVVPPARLTVRPSTGRMRSCTVFDSHRPRLRPGAVPPPVHHGPSEDLFSCGLVSRSPERHISGDT